eukprot:2569130-Rhodomonas_salina.3
MRRTSVAPRAGGPRRVPGSSRSKGITRGGECNSCASLGCSSRLVAPYPISVPHIVAPYPVSVPHIA